MSGIVVAEEPARPHHHNADGVLALETTTVRLIGMDEWDNGQAEAETAKTAAAAAAAAVSAMEAQ